jgi:hypothetical protein
MLAPPRTPAVIALALLVAGAPAWPEPRVVDLSIRHGELPKEARVIRVRQGDEVTLHWRTDAALTIHLHGYDLETKLAPGAPVSMRFSAKATGRFPIEVHVHGAGGERTLGYLEVHPR